MKYSLLLVLMLKFSFIYQLEEQSNKLSEIEAESKQTEAQMSAMTGGRPKSARPITRMAMAAKGGKKVCSDYIL